VLRAVTPATCSGSPYFSVVSISQVTPPTTVCNSGLTATVDWGASGPPANAHVQATIDDGTNNPPTVALLNNGNNKWVSSSAVPLAAEGGALPITIGWCVGTCTANNAFAPFNGGKPVQQIFSGSDGSSSLLPGGPIAAAQVIDITAGSPDPVAYSFVQNQSATLAVSVGLTGGVHLPITCPNSNPGPAYSCATDPPILLRFTTGSGNDSQTFAIDCSKSNPTFNLRDMIEKGCTDPYSINEPDVCPDPANPTPPDCAPVKTGAATGQVHQGMDTRFAPNGQCLPNNYPNVPDPSTDPRAVTLIITDFSAFTGSGGSPAQNVPVVTFATFYVTGWDQATSACDGINEPAPANDPTKSNGSNIWGHFIADINLGAVPNGEVCVPGVTPCAIALTR